MTDSTMASTAGIRIIKAFDNLLKCGICYEYFTTTVITPCSHNYCSICIRQSLSYRNQCPSCYEETNDSQLRPNRIVDQFLTVYFSIKDKISSNYYDLSSSSDAVSIKSNVETCSSDIKLGDVASTSKGITPSLETIPVTARAENAPCTPKKELRIPSMFSPKKNHVVKTNDVKVSCPVCSVEIPEKNINVHLDVCLQRMNEKKCQPEKEKRKLLPKLVYNLLGEKDLRKKLSDIGLSTIGDRKMLINRHKKYTLLYNAECDSLNPRPVSEIIKQVKKEEEEEKKVSAQPVKMLKLNVDRKADEKANERAQQQYLQEHKSHFEKLVEAVRRNMKSKKDMDKSGTVDKTPDIITLSENSSDHSDVGDEINRSSHKRKIIDSDSDEPARDISEVSIQVIKASVHPHIPPKSSNSKLEVSKGGGLHGEQRIHRPTKRMLVKSDSESDEPVEDIHDTITQKLDVGVHPPNTTNFCDKLKVTPDAIEKFSDINSDSAMKAMSNINNNNNNGQHLLDIYNESTEELSSSDDEYPRKKIFQQACLKNQGLKENAISPEKTLTSATSVSPVLTSKQKNNQTPKSKFTPLRSGRGDLTTRLQLKTTSVPSSSKEKPPAGQELEDDAYSSDSSNHSESLLMYTGPDCESQFAQCTPTKSPTSFSPLKSPSTVPGSRDGNFDLGIEDILKDSEEFEALPVRRQSRRILNASRNSPNLSANVVRRVQIDDL